MRISIISIISILLFLTSIFVRSVNFQSSTIYDKEIVEKNDYLIKPLISSDSIIIYSDIDLLEYNFPGNGTLEDPFRIENLSIQNENYGIYINHPQHYFVIQNCYIDSCTFGGIVLKKITSGYGNITHNTINNSDQGSGIFLQECSGLLVKNNTCSYNINGINVRLTENCSISDNTCSSNFNNGINVEFDSPNCTYTNNVLIDNVEFGFLSQQAQGSKLYNNSLSNNTFAIYEDTLIDYLRFEMLGNRINNKSIIYLTNSYSLTINSTDIGALYLMNCSFILVENLKIESNYIGIHSFGSNNCTFKNNEFQNNFQVGLFIQNSNYTEITKNNFTNYVGGSGFLLTNSFYVSITENNFTYTGVAVDEIELEAVPTLIIENNMINDKKLGYFFEKDSFTISEPEYGQLIFFNCSDIVLTNQNIQYTQTAITVALSNEIEISSSIINNNEIGLDLINSQNISIVSSSFNGNSEGIVSSSSENISIDGCIMNSNLLAGLYFVNSEQLEINNCEISFNGFGLYFIRNDDVIINGSYISKNTDLNMYFYQLHRCTISYVEIFDADYGIYLRLSDNVNVLNCIIKNATYDGIFILNSYRVYVLWCNISLNFYGVKAQVATYGHFLYNTFAGNEVYAISLDLNSDHNLIHHNIFNENQVEDETRRLSQCSDDGYNNTWYDIETFEGNWWSNIRGYHYSIAGSAYSVDIFPLNPVETSTIPNNTNESSFSFISVLLLIPYIAKLIQRKRRK